jgi:hypothetical protein
MMSEPVAKVGTEFDCHFTGPEGKQYTAHVKVTQIDGDNVPSELAPGASTSSVETTGGSVVR